MDYLKFFELEEEPFRNDPDPRFYFESRAQSEARMRLLRGLQQRRGLSVVVGGPGCGKTTLARHVPESLDRERFTARAMVVAHSSVDRGWLVRRIARAFGVAEPRRDPLRVLSQIYERLATLQRSGRHPVLLLDEAQWLRNTETMEEFRGLLNLEHQGRRLLSLVLLGMDPLDEVLAADPALAQRVEVRVRLEGLDRDEVDSYLAHRLECAKGSLAIFSQEALSAIYRFSSGTPRLVNTLADNALFEAFLSRAKPVDASAIATAADQLGLGGAVRSRERARPNLEEDPTAPEPAEESEGIDFDEDEDTCSSLDLEAESAQQETSAALSPEGEDASNLDALAMLGGTTQENLAIPTAPPPVPRPVPPVSRPVPPPPSAPPPTPAAPPRAAPNDGTEDAIDELFDDIQIEDDA